MNIYKLIGRNVDISDAMRSYAEDKLGKLNRFNDQIVDAKVVMSYAASEGVSEPARVEVQVNVPNGIVRAEESGKDTYAAIDKVVDKLERQLRKFKTRSMSRRNEPAPAFHEAAPALELEEEEAPEREPEIVRIKRFTMRPMAPEDAAIQMEALGHSFFVFRNLETDEISVLYLRKDGNYGLIETGS